MSEDNVKRGNAPKSSIRRTRGARGRPTGTKRHMLDDDNYAVQMGGRLSAKVVKEVEAEMGITLPKCVGDEDANDLAEIIVVKRCEIAVALAAIITIGLGVKHKGDSK